MRCEDCKRQIIGKPAYTGSTRTVGNGFYAGSRPTAVCTDCAARMAEINASSAYRAQLEQGTNYRNILREMGKSDVEIREMFASGNWGASLVEEIMIAS